MENQEDLIIYKINIEPEISKEFQEMVGYEPLLGKPHFFVKASSTEKRYRISASFEFINKKWDLKIGIIRDLSKIKNLEIFKNTGENKKDIAIIDFNENPLYSNLAITISEEILANNLSYKRFFDPINETFIFIITRNFDNNVNQSVVFFSKNFWSIIEYTQEIKKNL